jgi:hypothetical protein
MGMISKKVKRGIAKSKACARKKKKQALPTNLAKVAK